ncbi:hypothetical protein [Tunturiibacter gelidiferens]|uniref:hypothetical protein n=1 Tax=Tunturiibacter gelidiferens TaxID=3069689 RepID=UPI003D9BE1EC
MPSRHTVLSLSFLVLLFAFASSLPVKAQDQASPVKRGRKYKSPPATSHIEVTVVKKFNGKPIMNAAVIFNPSMDGKDEGTSRSRPIPMARPSSTLSQQAAQFACRSSRRASQPLPKSTK